MSTKKCPICGKPRDEAYRPFCSRRCADVDLGKWSTGSYAIPGEEVEPMEDTSEQDEAGAAPSPRRLH